MWTRNIIREVNYYNESLIYYMIQHAMILYGDNDTALVLPGAVSSPSIHAAQTHGYSYWLSTHLS
eukprot:COSAG02_NODE_251_length_27002_cov_13.799242_11_plen_65_part_00